MGYTWATMIYLTYLSKDIFHHFVGIISQGFQIIPALYFVFKAFIAAASRDFDITHAFQFIQVTSQAAWAKAKDRAHLFAVKGFAIVLS